MLEIIGAGLIVVKETMIFLNKKTRSKFQKDYDELLKEVDRIKNVSDKNWCDRDVDVLRLRIVRFLKVYAAEVRKSNMANL
ncbi:hypothetical protein KA005_57695 [bacterium]|nr:hypothetical protein [bacterium]